MIDKIATREKAIDPRLLAILGCPRCHRELQMEGCWLFCKSGHKYPTVDGVPVFILPEKQQTIGVAAASYDAAYNRTGHPLYIETLGLSESEKVAIKEAWGERANINHVDPVVSYLIGATSGLGYVKLIGRLTNYPIPSIPVSQNTGGLLLDLGCNWGRWSVSAARKGWRVVGIDPSLGAIMAARRAFKTERELMFVCGDARFLPFRDNTFQSVFSYSVIQHFSETDAELALREVGRVLQPNAYSKIQMAHRGGLRSTYVRTRGGYAKGGIFRVRYWSLAQLTQVFGQSLGPSTVIPEAFGGLGLLPEDWQFVSVKAKGLIVISAVMRKIAQVFRPLVALADSVYVISKKNQEFIRSL
jgi:SAM-dependent methyltransferase/uncharacterized protein YbaR (Trm112 family)